MIKKYLLIALFQLIYLLSIAQDNNPPEMADQLRSSGKIYVVIAVLITIFAGIIGFLIYQEIKITKLEKKLNGITTNKGSNREK